MKKSISILYICLSVAVAGTSQAALTAYTENFSAESGTNGWVSAGATATLISHISSPNGDYDDGNEALVLPYAEGMTITGDGVLGDGALWFNIQNAVEGDEAVAYALSGTLETGEQVTLSGGLFNHFDNTFYKANVQLWDVTADSLLVESGVIIIAKNSVVAYAPVDFSLNYTATSAEAGHAVEIRILESGNALQRDVFLDNISVSSVIPEPTSIAMLLVSSSGMLLLRRLRY